ncbi:basic proline-rich protein-like [Myotis myotis]|uniref:basic proline-rich protein-like n=1 Tax=Myotis myotis TaxID=51298 RepID=UPI0017489662|nr:basic proline-rich protein-like [Myotis myotis]
MLKPSSLPGAERPGSPPWCAASGGKGHEQNTGRGEAVGSELYCTKRAAKSGSAAAALLRGQGRHRGRREGGHLHLRCPPRPPASAATPRGRSAAQPGGRPGRPGARRAARGAAAPAQIGPGGRPPPGRLPAPGSRLRARPDGGGGSGGGNAGASSLRPAGRPPARRPVPGCHPARSPPPPAMSAAAGCRQSRCRPAAAGSSPPPLFFVRCERRRGCGARAEAPSLPRPLLRGEGPERGCPAPPRPPSVPPALSGSCLLLLLLLPVVQAPPSLLSFAARISLEFYSLPHVTHRVKLHLRRVTHQHSASPSRPGHRQQQPPRTEEPQPGSQPAPPSAECAAAAHGNSRVRPEELERPRPPALEAELAEALRFPSGEAQGFSREGRRRWAGTRGGGEE